MHHLDLGLYKYQVEYTQELLKEWCDPNGVAEFDNRLGMIPRFPGLKLFKRGLGNIKRFTAEEFRAMMRQLVFVVDGIIVSLHKSNYTENQAKNMDKKLVQLYVNWNKMYIFFRRDEFTKSDLKTFKVNTVYINTYICMHCICKITFLKSIYSHLLSSGRKVS